MKTKADWERLGREAVRLGMPCSVGLALWGDDGNEGRFGWVGCRGAHDGWGNSWPDLCDTLTELALIPWVKSAAREVYGEAVRVRFSYGEEFNCVDIHDMDNSDRYLETSAPTLAEAAIAAVQSMRGEGQCGLQKP